MPARAAAARKGGQTKKVRTIDDDLAEPTNAPKDDKPQMAGHALCCLSPTNCLRRLAFKFSFSSQFEGFILACILVNLAFMIVQSPMPCRQMTLDGVPECDLYDFINDFDFVVTIIFTFESFIKIIALGLCGKHAYTADPWNKLDLFVVIACWAAFFMESPTGVALMGGFSINLSAFRALRALRPLKAIKFLAGVQAILASLAAAVFYLLNVGTLMMFFLAVFGILGMQFFKGVLRQHCAENDVNVSTPFYSGFRQVEAAGVLGSCSMDPAIGYQCQSYNPAYSCQEFGPLDQMNLGYTNFDNFFYAFLLMFQAATADSWGVMMYALKDTQKDAYVAAFFIGINLFVSTLVLNMFIAVISAAFGQARAAQDEQEKKSEADKRASAFSYETVGEARLKKRQGCCRRFCPCLPCCHCLQEEVAEVDPDAEDEEVLQPPLPIPQQDKQGDFCLQTQDGMVPLGCPLWTAQQHSPTEVISMFVYHPDDEVHDMLKSGLVSMSKKECLPYSNYQLVWCGLQLLIDESEVPSRIHEAAEPANVFWLRLPQAEGRPEKDAEYLPCYFTLDHKFVPVDDWFSTQQIRALNNVFHMPFDRKPKEAPKPFVYPAMPPMYENPVTLPYYSDAYAAVYVEDGYLPGQCMWCFTWFIKQPLFDNFILLCIGINTVTLAMERYGQPADEKAVCDILGLFLNLTFLMEMLLKMIGMGGPHKYLKVGSNIFDFFIVATSIPGLIETFMPSPTSGSGTSGGPSFSLFRIFRLARVGRVVRMLMKIEDVRKLLNTVFGSMTALTNLMFFLTFCLVVFSILAMQLFAGQFTEQNIVTGELQSARNNFDYFGSSMLALFIIMTGDNWASVMYTAMASKDSGWAGFPYFFIYFFFASFVLLNLFVAVILENFGTEEEEKIGMAKSKFRAEEKQKNVESSFFLWEAAVRWRHKRNGPQTHQAGDQQQLALMEGKVKGAPLDIPVPLSDDSSDDDSDTSSSSESDSAATGAGTKSVIELQRLQSSRRRLSQIGMIVQRPKVAASFLELHGHELDNSLCLCSSRNYIRRLCTYIANASWFDQFIVLVILLSSFTLAIDTPDLRLNGIDGDKSVLPMLDLADVIFLVIFCTELVVKVISKGFLFSKNAYMSDGWNIMDFVVVCGALLDFVPGIDTSFTRILRILRVLRPLRMINKFPDLKIIINATLASIGPLMNVVILMMLLFLMFAILGLSLFSGKFWYCTNPQAIGKADCHGNWTDYRGAVHDSVWTLPDQTFDNAGAALITLFEVSTLASWSPVMFNAMDCTTYDKQPEQNANAATAVIYFVLFVFIGAFFITQLFIGVIIDKYGSETGISLLSSEQMLWRDMQKVVNSATPDRDLMPPPESGFWGCFCLPLRRWCFRLCTNEKFDLFIMGCIVLNVIFMLTDHHPMDKGYGEFLTYFNLVFVWVFFAEMVIKLLGLGFSQYIMDNWNVFDGIIVTLSIAPMVASWVGASNSIGGIASVARTFRIGRAMRLIKRFKSLNQLFTCLLLSIPSLTHIVILYMLMVFVFAVLGIQLFAFSCASPDCGATEMNTHSNFQNVMNAMLTLFRISTMDSWPAVRADLERSGNSQECRWAQGNATNWQEQYGDDYVLEWKMKYNCGSYQAATAYCISFIVVGAFVFLQLVVAVVLDNFNSIFNSESDSPLMASDVELFKQVFKKYDVDQTGTIPFEQLYSFLTHLGEQEIASRRKSCVLGRLPGIKVYTNAVKYLPVQVKGVWMAKAQRAQQTYIGMYRRQKEHQDVNINIRLAQWIPSMTYRDFQSIMLNACSDLSNDFKIYTKAGKLVDPINYEDMKFTRDFPEECKVDGTVVGKLPADFEPNMELIACSKDDEYQPLDEELKPIENIAVDDLMRADDHDPALDALTWDYNLFLAHVETEMRDFSDKAIEQARSVGKKIPEANVKFAHLLYFCALKRVGINSLTYRDKKEKIHDLTQRHDDMKSASKDQKGAGFNLLLRKYNFDPNAVVPLVRQGTLSNRVHPMNSDFSDADDDDFLSPISSGPVVRGKVVSQRTYKDSSDSDSDDSDSSDSDSD